MKISVVMPAYNAEKYIGQAIESVLNQTVKDFEFIIINDGSVDRTKDIILSYPDKRIVYLENDKNSGIVDTLNRGLDYATGEYIARMDADDIAVMDRFEKQEAVLENNSNIGVVGSNIRIFGEEIESTVFCYSSNPKRAKAELIFNSSLAHPAVMIRHSILCTNNIMYEKEYQGLEDYVLWWRISKFADVMSIDEVLLNYRKHKKQITQTRDPQFIEKLRKFSKERLHTLVDSTENEEKVFFKYCEGNYTEFSNEEIINLSVFYSKLLEANRKKRIFDGNELKIVFGLSVVYVINHLQLQVKDRIKILYKCYKQGGIPGILFCKVMIIWLFRG